MCFNYSRKPVSAKMEKLHTQSGAIMMILMSIFGQFDLIEFLLVMRNLVVFKLLVTLNAWFCYTLFRSTDCFSLGWPMRDDGTFFRSTQDMAQVKLNFLLELIFWSLLHIIAITGKKGFSKKIWKHRQILFCGNPNFLAHLSKF